MIVCSKDIARTMVQLKDIVYNYKGETNGIIYKMNKSII